MSKHLYLERFCDVVEMMLGERPNTKDVDNWVSLVEDDSGGYKLQEWVVNQKNLPSWCEGIVFLEAVGGMVDDARDGNEQG